MYRSEYIYNTHIYNKIDVCIIHKKYMYNTSIIKINK